MRRRHVLSQEKFKLSNEWLLKRDPAWIVYVSTLPTVEGGSGPRLRTGSGLWCPGVLRTYEPRGRILKCDSQTFILMWVIWSEISCYYFLMAEIYQLGSIKRIKQTSAPVKIAKCSFSLVLRIFGARQCACLHIQATFWGALMCVFIHTSDVFSVLSCFQLSFYFQQILLF